MNLPTLPRDPTADVRTRRFMDLLHGILNSLLTQLAIIQTEPGTFVIATNTDQFILANQIFGA